MTNPSKQPSQIGRRSFVALTATAMGAGVLAVTAGPSSALGTSDAERFITDIVADLRALVDNDRSGADGAAEFLALLERKSSLDAIARFAMGRTWNDMSEGQQAAYSKAFRNYIANTYQNRFGEYAGEDIIVTGSTDAGKKGVLVISVLKRPSAEDVNLEWLVSDRGGETRLSDLIFEGVSLAITLRETFGGMVETRAGNIDTFIEDLGSSNGA